MLFRIHIILAFPASEDAYEILDKAKDSLVNAITIHPGMANEEKGYIILEECYHDEDPIIPCNVLEEYHTE